VVSTPALRVRKATPSDAEALAPRLRPDDRRELIAATGQDPAQVLREGVAGSSESHAILDREGEVLALFGVSPDPRRADAGLVWLLASEGLVAHGIAFLRGCRAWIDELQRRHRILWNNVDARNQRHLDWLEFCGFRRVKTIAAYGPEGRPFHQVVRVREGAGAR
jgi:hypothetical protein